MKSAQLVRPKSVNEIMYIKNSLDQFIELGYRDFGPSKHELQTNRTELRRCYFSVDATPPRNGHRFPCYSVRTPCTPYFSSLKFRKLLNYFPFSASCNGGQKEGFDFAS